jgi:hypothetical protein
VLAVAVCAVLGEARSFTAILFQEFSAAVA